VSNSQPEISTPHLARKGQWTSSPKSSPSSHWPSIKVLFWGLGITVIIAVWLGGAVAGYPIHRVIWSIFGEDMRKKSDTKPMTKDVDFLMTGPFLAGMICFACFLIEDERDRKQGWKVRLLKAYFEAMISVGLLSRLVEGVRKIVKLRNK
jgi:hypothetical protein